MKTLEAGNNISEPRNQVELAERRSDKKDSTETQHERWAHCHVNWTAVWIGALATFSLVLLFGLVGIALGAHVLGSEHRVVDLKKIGLWTLIFSVCGAFFASVLGGWVAAKIAGIVHSEPAMLHGAFVWLVTLPILVACSGLGASSLLGGWYSGLSTISASNPTTPYVHPDPLGAAPTSEELATFRTQQAEYTRNIKQWNEDTPKVIRISALGTVTAMLLALLGCVIGGWMASGEPMNFTHYRSRKPRYHAA
jgi:hypothetical protein